MKKYILILLMALPAALQAQHKAKIYDLLIGTYTTGKSEGIYVYRFNTQTGKATYLNKVTGVNNPSYITVSCNRKFVYSVNEVGTARTGSVSSLSFEPKTGALTFLNKQPSIGAGPCYILADKANKNVFVANYAGGSLSVLPIKADGTLGEPSQTIQDEGTSVDTARQKGPHVHTAALSPDEHFLFYTDLGTDKLNICQYDPSATKPLSPATTPYITVKPGNGPRHIAISPDKKYLYLIQEMGTAINVYHFDNGTLKEILNEVQTVNITADGFTGKGSGADIHISPDGRFLYSSNRGDANDIQVYAINKLNGKLTFVERTSSLGKTPRNFNIDPSGNFLLVANQNSDDIYIFRINKATGKLTYTGEKLEIGNPSCLKFAAIN
ncbi:lactonase family protein [Mucilaginibacter sp. HMF5004]|uniref:lactonase family protein n=1 Tax=Mucilaginibacter rivuli TaxID=2857527 RepID=UPI001C5E29AD|nr:lactonase family protein [Mucilaginibacter rivuli]MBW4891178.1 lactonase family protein [Mucilaginibacter rivuli]